MPLTPDDVKGIATLARLAIDEKDISTYADSLSRIIAFVGQLDAAETDTTQPMAHPVEAPQRLRLDEVTAIDQHDLYQSNATGVEAGLYTVPRVIE